MDTKVLLGVVALVLVLGGGYWYMSSTAEAPAPVPIVENQMPDGGAAGTVLEGSGEVVGPADEPRIAGYTLATVAEHATAESCWSAVNGNVYDLTKWIPLHPGGEAKIKMICGKDGSAAFTGQHGGQEKPETTLATYKIGVLGE